MKLQRAKKQGGFTLVEMLVAMAVFAIVMASVYTVIGVGLKARENHNVEMQQNARAALDDLSARLRMAFTVKGAQMYTFDGGPSNLSFYIFPPGANSPARVEYGIGDGSKCAGLCRRIFTAPFDPDAPRPQEEPVAQEIKSIEFSYSNNSGWADSWTSSDKLPDFVRIKAVTSAGKDKNAFETTVGVPLSKPEEKKSE